MRVFLWLCHWFLRQGFRLIGKELTDIQWHIWEQFIKFALISCSNVLICLLICYLVIDVCGESCYLFGHTIGYISATFNSFYWNSKYVFPDYERDKPVAFVKMFFCSIVIYVLQITISFLSVNTFGMSEWIAPIFAVIVAQPVNFMLNKFFAFR